MEDIILKMLNNHKKRGQDRNIPLFHEKHFVIRKHYYMIIHVLTSDFNLLDYTKT